MGNGKYKMTYIPKGELTMASDTETNVKFICPVCNASMDHTYTQAELINSKALEFACERCGSSCTPTPAALDATEKDAIAQMKKDFVDKH